MDSPVKIFRFGMEDARKISTSKNEPHVHDFEEIIIGMKGAVEHFIDFNSTVIEAPYLCFVTKGKVHRIQPFEKNGQCDAWIIRFNSEFIAQTIFQLYASFHNNASISWPLDRATGQVPALTEMMQTELQKPQPNYAIIHHLLNAIISYILAEINKQGLDVGHYQNETFTSFLAILEENFRRPVNVSFYAEKLFMSSRNLNLICQNVVQQSISEIIETRKLIEAKNLLTSTDRSISEIAFELGYNENSYFSNVFKKKSGQTPGEFRDEMRNLLTS